MTIANVPIMPIVPSKVATFLDAYEIGPGVVAPVSGGPAKLAGALDRMRVEHTPFTYGIIDDFLPRDSYEAVLRDWPTEASFRPVAMLTVPEVDDFGSRRVLPIDDTNASAADGFTGRATGVWAQISAGLRAPTFVRALFTRFSDVIDVNLRGVEDNALTDPNVRLNRCVDQGGEDALKAHVDVVWKLLTIVVYLDLNGAVDEESEQLWGTSLYHAEPSSDATITLTPNADHELAGRVSFVPNRAFVMPNCRHALHGVVGGQAGVRRRTLMCGYRAGNGPL